MAEQPAWMQDDDAEPTNAQRTAGPTGMGQPSWMRDEENARPAWMKDEKPTGRPTWLTGAQRGSIENGWQTPFYEKMFKQREEADKAKEDPTARTDFTGVVTYDNIVVTRDGERRELKMGDVYEDGKRVENVYDYGKDKGNAILTQLSMDAKEQAELFQSAKGDQAKIETALRDKAQGYTEAAQARVAQDEFIADRERVEDEWGVIGKAAVVAGGAVGGALTGLVGGPWGAVVGAIGGGIGALLNQDELIDQFAEAQVKLDRAGETGNAGIWLSTAVGQYGGAVGSFAQPLTNLGMGIADAVTGGFADTEAAREEEALQGLPMEVLRLGLGFGDAVLQFASKPGAALYMGSMGARTLGGVGMLTTGQQWDDRKREFNAIADSGNPLEDVGRWASAIGAVGIDAIQTFTPGAIMKSADRALGTARNAGSGIDDVLGFEKRLIEAADGGNKVALTATKLLGIETSTTKIVQGRTFNMKNGMPVSVSRVPTVTLLAPSELTGWMTVRATTMLKAARGKGVTVDDLYANALSIRTLSPAKQALVTGFGEGTEEFVQSFLDNWSQGYTPSVEELLRATAGGFVLGAGMARGSRVGRDPIMQGFNQVNANLATIQADLITEDNWRKMTEVERERMRQSSPQVAAASSQARKDLILDNVNEAFNTTPGRAVLEDTAKKALESQLQSGLKLGERTVEIAGIGNPQVPGDVARIELEFLFEALQKQSEVFQSTGRKKQADALTSLLTHVKALTSRVLVDKSLARTDVTDMDLQRADGSVIPAGTNSIQAANLIMEDAFKGKGVLPTAGTTATWDEEEARQGIEMVFQRSPSDSNGSWMLLRPEIDTELTTFAVNGPTRLWAVSHAVLKGLSGDFDGDGAALRSYLDLADSGQARSRLRAGLNVLAEETIMIDSYAAELAFATEIISNPKSHNVNSFIYKTLMRAKNDIVKLLLPSGEGSAKEIEAAVMRNLIDPLLKGQRPDAKQAFWSYLVTTKMLEKASFHSNERVVFRINDVWVQALNEIGTILSIEKARNPVDETGAPLPAGRSRKQRLGANTPSALPSSQAKRHDPTPAATLFQYAQLVTPGNDPVRVSQKFNYSALASQTLDAESSNRLTAWANNLYRILASGETRSKAETATKTDEIVEYTQHALNSLLIQLNAERAAAGESMLTPVDLARISVPNVDLRLGAAGVISVFDNSNPEVSVLQLVMRNAVEHFASMDREILSNNDNQLQTKYNRLAHLGMKATAKEVFGNMMMDELIGIELSAAMGWTQMTLDNAISDYTKRGPIGRKEIIRKAKAQKDAYGKTESTEKPINIETLNDVPSFRTIVDIVETSGNLFASLGADGLASENTTAGKQDANSIEALEEASVAARRLFRDAAERLAKDGTYRRSLHRGTNKELTREQLQELFELDHALARRIMEVVPPEVRFAVFTEDAQGGLTAPPWFYEFVLEENKERAAFRLWRGILLAQMEREAPAKDDKKAVKEVSSDRLIALYQLLGNADPTGRAQARFEQALASSKSIKDFLKFVNLNLNGDRPPQMAILRDQVTFDLAFSHGGWRPTGEAADFRERIQAMVTQIHESTKNLDQMLIKERESDVILYKLIKTDLKGNPQPDREAYAQLEKAVNRALKMATGTGPNVLLNSMLTFAIGLVGNESDKAKAARGTEGIGQVKILEQAAWNTPLQQLLAAWTSVSEMDAASRPDNLLKAQNIVLRDGTPVAWPGLTADIVIELLRDPAMRPMVVSLLSPTIFDQPGPDGQASLRTMTKTSLQDVLGSTAEYRAILNGNTHADRMNFLSMMGSRLKNDEVMLYAANLLIARTSGSPAPLTGQQYLTWAEDAYDSAARIFMMLGQIPKNKRATVAKLLDDMMQQSILKDSTDETLGDEEKAAHLTLTTTIQDQFFQQRKGLSGTALKQAEAYHERVMNMLKSNNSARTLIAEFTIPSDVTLQHDAKRRIWEEVNSVGNIWSSVSGDDKALTRDFLGKPVDRKLGYPNPYPNNPDLTKKYWDAVSRTLLVYKAGAGTGQFSFSPEARASMAVSDPEFRMMLGDWSFLYEFAQPVNEKYPMWDAATSVFEDLTGESILGGDPMDLVNLIKREIFENNHYPLGQWSTSYAGQAFYAKNKTVQAPADQAISLAGSIQALEITVGTATKYTRKEPLPNTRTYTFSSDALFSRNDKGDVIPLTMEDRQRPRDMGNGQQDKLAMLQGRFVKSFKVFRADDTELDLYSQLVKPTLEVSHIKEAQKFGLQATSPDQIIAALNEAQVGRLDVANLTFEVEFYHPHDKPKGAEWANNIFYEGVPSGRAADAGISAFSSNARNSGQIQLLTRRALDALKKAKSALDNPELPPIDVVRSHEDPNDMAATIEYKVSQIMLSDPSVTMSLPSDENTVRKQLMMQTILRGILEDGSVVVYSAEEAIEYQKSGRNDWPPMTKVQIQTIPMDFVRTMLGEQGVHGSRMNLNPKDFSTSIKTWNAWKGTWPREVLQKYMPGMLDPNSFEFSVSQLRNSMFAKMSDLRPVAARRRVSQRELQKYDSIVDIWHKKMVEGGLANRSTEHVKEELRKLSEANLQKAAEWDSNRNQASVVPLSEFNIDTGNALSDLIPSRLQRQVTARLQGRSDEDALSVSETGAVWMFEPGGKRHPQSGYISNMADLDYNAAAHGKADGRNPIPGDVILVDPAWQGFELSHLDTLLSSGYRIRFVGPATSNDKISLAKRHLEEAGRFIQEYGLWALANPRRTAQTATARESMLGVVRRRSTERMLAYFADTKLEGEQQAYIVDPKLLEGREIYVGKTFVQSNAFPSFQRPDSSPEAIATVNKYLDLFQGPERDQWIAHLAKIGKASVEEITISVDRAILNTNRDTGLPTTKKQDAQAEPLKFGDFIFLVDAHGQVIITRHGHKPFKTNDNNRARDEMLESSPFPGRRGGIAIFTNEYDDMPSFYEGHVWEWKLDDPGLTASLRVPLSALADKMIFTDDGLKIVGTPLSSADFTITNLQVSKNIPLAYIISYADFVSKEGRGIDSANSAIEYLGFDMIEPYARVLLGMSQVEWDAIAEELAQGKPERHQAVVSDIMTFFKDYQRNLRDSSISLLEAQEYVNLLNGNLKQIPDIFSGMISTLPPEVTKRLNSLSDQNVMPELKVTLAALAYLATPLADPEAILTSAGVDGTSGEITSMPEVFTNVFQGAPLGSALEAWFFKRLNARMPRIGGASGQPFEGWSIRPGDYMFEIRTPGQPMREGVLSFSEAHSTGVDNGAIFSQSFLTSTTQRSSESLRNMAILALYGADAGHASKKVEEDFRKFLGGKKYDTGTEQGLSAMFRGVKEKYIPPVNMSSLWTPAENMSQAVGAYNVQAFSAIFDMTGKKLGWTDETKREFEESARTLMRQYHLNENDWEVVHGWIRRYLWRPKEADSTPDMAEYGHVSFEAAKAALNAIQVKLASGRYPTWQADVPGMAADEVSMFIQAFERSGGQGFIPDPLAWSKLDKNDPLARPKDFDPRTLTGNALREYFYEAALGEMKLSPVAQLNQPAVDGFMDTYRTVFADGGSLPLSLDPLRRLQLLDPDLNNIVLSLDKNYRDLLKVIPTTDVIDMRVSNVFGGTLLEGRYVRDSYLKKDELSKAKKRQEKWLRERNLATSTATGQQINTVGHIIRSTDATTNSAMRVLMNLRLANGMFHPWLYLSAPMETAVRNSFESAVTLLTGESFSKVGQIARSVDDRIRNSAFGQTTLYKELSGNAQPTISIDTLIHADAASSSLASDPRWTAMIHGDLYQDRPHMGGRFERFTERMVRVFGKWQDPSYGIRPSAAADRLIGGIIKHFETVGIENGYGLDEALTIAQRSPHEFKATFPVAYQMILNGLSNARTLKATSFSLFARSIIDPLSNHNKAMINIPSNLMLKIPFAFQNYAFNVATNMLGLQGVDAMLALALQGRQSGRAWGKTQAWLSGDSKNFDPEKHGTDYLGNVLESVNFADAFIRAGMTHTALMGLGLVLGSLAGGDEEEKKRRRREEMLAVGHVYDPRDFENDWRNADAIYLEGLFPFLVPFFGLKTEDGEVKAPAELHWTLKQFISPIVGISKFINTGNFNHLYWGFDDALGSMPLLNAMAWNDAATAATELFSMSIDADQADDALGTEPNANLVTSGMQNVLDGVFKLERMLFENSFINSVYTAADKYDRDPFTLQDIDADGIIQRDNLNKPMETTAMNEYLDSQGNMAQGKINREGLFGQLRAYSERRGTLAFFGSLITGFDDQNTLWRYNMAEKQHSVEKQQTTVDEATSLILSQWNGEIETLNVDGAEAFLKSIHAGYITKDSPVLQNIFLTQEQRQEVTDRLHAASLQDSYNHGFDAEFAEKRWSKLFWGTSDNPWATPLYDVIWSKRTHEDQIPYYPATKYSQLNTTWVIGPDGKPWATGIARGELYNFFGQTPLHAYSGAGQGNDPIGNLTVDERLNATDKVGNVNTGMRSLEKVNQTIANPTDDDILKSIKEGAQKVVDAIKGADFTKEGGGYSRYFGGGGGGGGGYRADLAFMPFQNAMRQPYTDNIPNIYSGNPSIRRDDIRRTRFSSERGRLNQWQ